MVRQDLETVFDASQSGAARSYTEDIGITLLSHETRISGGAGRSQWVGGISGVFDINRLTRSLGPVDAPLPIAGVRNENSELAAFGRYAFPLFGTVTATLGGRMTYARSVGVKLATKVAEADEPRRSELRFSPTVALSWAAAPSLFVFAQYQEGFRVGGLAVADGNSTAVSTRFEPDTLRMVEAGGRIAANLVFKLRGGAELLLDGSLRYVGRSQLGVGAPLDVPQRNFLEGALGGRLAFGRYGVWLDVTNVGDARRNRFAFGNPFGLMQRDQITPLRPRSIRLGIDARF